MKAKIVLVAGAGVFCGLAALWVIADFKNWKPSSIGAPAFLRSTTADSSLDPQTLERFLALEAQQRHLDETIWAKEILAQRFEKVFVDLWDELRRQPDPWAVLENFSFKLLRLGTAQPSEALENGVSRIRFAEPLRSLDRNEWKSTLQKFRVDGYRIAQSEWRQQQFETSRHSPPQSTIAMSLHLLNPEKQRRILLRGKLHVHWPPERAEGETGIPERIDVAELELIDRTGAPSFEQVLARAIQPENNPVFIDPVIVYDLNGDGFDEVILACRNFVYWNQGNGKFQSDRLCAFPKKTINAAIVADFDGDGRADLLGADRAGLVLYSGDAGGKFPGQARSIRFGNAELSNPFVMTAGDIDRDGDLDIWLAQYKLPYVAGQMPTPYYDANDGFPSFLLINDGAGGFRDATEGSGLIAKRFRRTYSSSFVDFDDDGDLDLMVVSDFAGVDLYENDGRGRFIDVTSRLLEESHSFGMAHTIGDYDGDERLDLCVIGMNSFVADRLESLRAGPADPLRMRSKMANGNRLYFRRGDSFRETSMSAQVAKSGWSWGATSADFDNDGDLDIYVANGHKSRATVQDYENQFWRHDIYVASSKHDRGLDAYFRAVATRLYGAGYSYGGYYKNCLFLNESGNAFVETGFLMGVAMEEDSRNVVSADLDGDGRIDLIVTTFEEWPRVEQTLCIFRNQFASAGNWIGFRLREHGKGFSPVGAKAIIETSRGKQIRHVVTGDSYRSQHSTTVHFGLGRDDRIDSVEIVWPNGQRQRMVNPAVNQCHQITFSPKASRIE
jgi:enediyne biosynthesis protein E4